MRIDGRQQRTIWLGEDGRSVLDHRPDPAAARAAWWPTCATLEDAAVAIETMLVRGAPLIGATAAYGVGLGHARGRRRTRRWTRLPAPDPHAPDRRQPALGARPDAAARCATSRAARRVELAYAEAAAICDEDVAICQAIGEHGLGLIRDIAATQAARRAGQRPDPLQRRLARHHRLGHGHRADLPRAGGRHPGPCLGRRDPAAQPGRLAHRVRAAAPGGRRTP